MPFLQGSAFLLECGGITFFVTAAHVLEPSPQRTPFWVRGGPPNQVTGSFTFARTNAVVDLAFAPLSDPMTGQSSSGAET
jgi:hypothetical protein